MKPVLVTVFTGIAILGSTACSGGPQADIERLLEARRMTGELLLQFSKATEAGSRAVMADTDDASAIAMREADEATSTIQKDAAALTSLLASLQYSQEGATLAEFQQRFEAFRSLDREILELAALDTNLKAQRLSFGSDQEAADAVRDTLAVVVSRSPSDWQIRAVAAEVMSSIREIQALQSPHIWEADDAAMTRLEARMKTAENSARSGLSALSKVVRPESRDSITTASARLDEFAGIHAEILKLSRHNSNVRSLALSLGKKRTLAAACEERLRAIQDALAKRDIGPSR